MTTMTLPCLFVPLVGLVFSTIAIVSLFLHIQNKIV